LLTAEPSDSRPMRCLAKGSPERESTLMAWSRFPTTGVSDQRWQPAPTKIDDVVKPVTHKLKH
jgi:hypothetical protein